MLTRLRTHLSQSPSGWVAHLIALVAVAAPATALGLSSTQVIWLGDTLPVVPTVVQFHTHGNRDLSGYLSVPRAGRWAVFPPEDREPYCVRRGADGASLYSSYPAGMEVFAWPFVLAASAAGQPIDGDDCQFWIERAAATVTGGLCGGLFFLAGLHLGRPGPAFVMSVLFATGSVVFTTLTQLLWQQTGVVFWMLVILLVELRARGQPGWKGTAGQSLACALMLACRPSAVTFLIPFGVWVLARNWRRGVVLPALAGVLYLPWAVMYHRIYGSPFGPSMAFLGQTWTPAANVLGVLFSPGRGLFVYQPWIGLLPLLLKQSVRTDPDRPLPPGWYPFGLAFLACHTLLVGSWGVWWGGYCWGSRLAAEVVPVAGLLCVRPVGWLMARWWGCAVLAIVAAVGVAVHAPYVYGVGGEWNIDRDIDAHPGHLWDWRNPPFRQPGANG